MLFQEKEKYKERKRLSITRNNERHYQLRMKKQEMHDKNKPALSHLDSKQFLKLQIISD